MIVWLSAIGIIIGSLLFTHYHTQYYRHALIGTLSILTVSLTYFQIITWANLIQSRLNVVNRLINGLQYNYREQIAWQSFNDTSIAAIENVADVSNSPVDDTFIFDTFRMFRDLCNRLWMQTNTLNERFKFSMVLIITNDFVHLVGLLYHIFICLAKNEKCEYLDFDILVCILNLFNLTIISRAGQNMANESLQITCALHRNKFIRCTVEVNSFVCSSSFNLFFHFLENRVNYLRVSFRFENFRSNCFIKKLNSTPLVSLILITHLFL